MAPQERHAIKMPSSLLDQIKDKEDKGDYNDDKKYASIIKKKRKAPELGRKEKRKEKKMLKKQKKVMKTQDKANGKLNLQKKTSQVKRSPAVESSGDEEEEEDQDQKNEDATWAALRALKLSKGEGTKEIKKHIPETDLLDDEDDEDDFAGFSGDEEYEDEEPTSIEETMAALKALKEKKQKGSKEAIKPSTKSKNSTLNPEETMLALKALKSKKTLSKKSNARPIEKKKTHKAPKTALMKEDEAQIEYYAKKLGLGKKDKLKDTGDGLDSLLDGLDFDFNSDEGSEEEVDYDTKKSQKKRKTNDYSDEETNSSNFDSYDDKEGDSDEEMALNDSEGDDLNESITQSSLDDDDDDEEQEDEVPKENPYLPATTQTSRYVPPAMRKKMLEKSASTETESEEVKRLKKVVNSSLNKLSEANFVSIITNELSPIYNEYPRQTVTEVLVNFILTNTLSTSKLLDSFIIVYAALVSAFYKLQGVEFAAFCIQKLVETMEEYIKGNKMAMGKELNNLMSLFGFVYNLSIFSSNLIFDIIKLLCIDIDMVKIESLLRLVSISGQKMRHEDPSSLKEIIRLATTSITADKTLSQNSRAKFLLETLQNLKNNKVKTTDQMENNTKILSSLKKQLLNLSMTSNDPIQVTLEDIHNIDTKGKWWLVGSAWKGSDVDLKKNTEVNEDVMNDILDSAEPNWNELADFYRMNTSIRKAIFIAIMSSGGFEEAMNKINKLRLKGHQKYEIPKILLICCSIEKHYNPFYGYLAKECCSDHDMRKTFQFNLWDLIKEFEGTDSDDSDSDVGDGGLGKLTSRSHMEGNDEESKLRKILSLGRLYGFLIGQKSLPLTVLKTVNFVTASHDTKLFMEILMVTFLDNVGKMAELSAFGTGSRKIKVEDMKFDDKKLIERLPKGQSVLLKGLQYFLQQNVRASELISGRRQTKRVEWGCDTLCEIIDEL